MARCIIVSILLLLTPVISFAAIPSLYTMENFFTSQHDIPISIIPDGNEGYYGYTATGLLYTQERVVNAVGVRLYKFSLGEAYFYMSDKGIIRAPNDLIAVSIYFSRL